MKKQIRWLDSRSELVMIHLWFRLCEILADKVEGSEKMTLQDHSLLPGLKEALAPVMKPSEWEPILMALDGIGLLSYNLMKGGLLITDKGLAYLNASATLPDEEEPRPTGWFGKFKAFFSSLFVREVKEVWPGDPGPFGYASDEEFTKRVGDLSDRCWNGVRHTPKEYVGADNDSVIGYAKRVAEKCDTVRLSGVDHERSKGLPYGAEARIHLGV